MISKQFGPVTVSVSAGIATIGASISQDLGGGSVAGFAKVSANTQIEIEAAHLADLGLEILEEKFPAIAPVIAMVKSAVDAELAKA